ncbi:protocadherin-12 [Limosa lapponica baueri]|uniref:Protocadherin-12 n=1 Tax=Limosa lapponica baueri TaxID=1758121 RepID=A0A2I0TFN5_LIMLA|nr:protocadherin-12 [Limosa lapponica baueri]
MESPPVQVGDALAGGVDPPKSFLVPPGVVGMCNLMIFAWSLLPALGRGAPAVEAGAAGLDTDCLSTKDSGHGESEAEDRDSENGFELSMQQLVGEELETLLEPQAVPNRSWLLIRGQLMSPASLASALLQAALSSVNQDSSPTSSKDANRFAKRNFPTL